MRLQFTIIICILLVLQIQLLLVSKTEAASASTINRKSSYGEFCSQDIKCNSKSWLSCQENRCDCLKPNEMVYEETYDSCVAKAGGRCTFAMDELKHDGLVFEVATCVPNAYCSPEGYCVCNNSSYENSYDGTCIPSRGHKEHCDSDRKCSLDQGLHCHNGLCQCDETVSIFEPKYNNGQLDRGNEGHCVGLSGHICINSKCVAHATCSSMDNLCMCLPGYYPDDDTNICLPEMEILDNCTSHYQCKKQFGVQLLCLNGLCNCNPTMSMYATAQVSIKSPRDDNEEYSKFHGFTGPLHTQCVGIAGSPCIDRLCVPHSYCSYTYPDSESKYNERRVKERQGKSLYSDAIYEEYEGDPRYQGICRCNKAEGYSESLSGFCGRGYAESCTPYTCIENLVCIDKLCACPHETQTYDSATRTCVSLIGGPCNATFSCGKKAECKVFDGIKGNGNGIGHCACIEGYVEFPNGEFCLAGYGSSCEASSECDSVAALDCIDGTCRCGKFSEYNEAVRKCVGLVGAKCDVSQEDECTRNAHCQRIHSKLPGNCVCDHGFFETGNYTCKSKL